MVLEAIFADVAQELLHLRNLHHPGPAEGIQRIIRKPALAYVTADPPGEIVRGESREAHGARFYATHAGAKGIFLAHGSSDNGLEVHLNILEEVFRQIAAMKADRFVGIIAVVVVPVE